MNEESGTKAAKNVNKPNGVQLTGIVLTLIGLVLTLFVAAVIGLPLLFIGLIINVIGAMKKSNTAQPETPES